MSKIMNQVYPGVYHSSTGYTFALLKYLLATGQPLYFPDGKEDIWVPGKDGSEKLSVLEPEIKTANQQADYEKTFKTIVEANGIQTIQGNPPENMGYSFASLQERELVDWHAFSAAESLKIPSIEALFNPPSEVSFIDFVKYFFSKKPGYVKNFKDAKRFEKEIGRFKHHFMTVSVKLKTDDPKLLAEEKSIGWPFFEYIRHLSNEWVLGQHHAKGKEASKVAKMARKYGVKVFDRKDKCGLLGFRGIDFAKQAHLMQQMSGMLNIASTTTWMGLTMFPELMQVIYYAKRGSNLIWEEISEAHPNAKAIGFDQDSKMLEIAKQSYEFFQGR